MKKEEFIAALASELRDLSKDDIARSLEYYGEMVDERVEDGMSVEEAVDALGGVETIARQIMTELPRERRERGNTFHFEPDDDDDDEDEDEDDGAREYHITEPFDSLNVQVGGMDVRVQSSGNDETRIETEHGDTVTETVEVRDGVLVIRQEAAQPQKKGWAMFGVHFDLGWSGRGSVTVYLAERLWESVSVSSISGEIETEDFSARAVGLSTKSGDIDARHLEVEGRLEAEAMSGDIAIGDVTALELSAHSMSGDVEIESVNAGSAVLHSKSGDIELEDSCVEGRLDAESISGDITIYRSDARELSLCCTSGDIDGTLLTPKAFYAHTTAGDVSVPESDLAAGRCEASTTYGDISLRIAP